MRILICSMSPANYSCDPGYNGAGWINSFLAEFEKRSDLQVAWVFNVQNPMPIREINGTKYYPVCDVRKSFFMRIKGGLFLNDIEFDKEFWPYYVSEYLKVIEDFQPDVIHVFGSEYYYGLVASETEIPVFLHLQGVLCELYNAYFPPGVSNVSYVLQDLNPYKVYKRLSGIAWLRRNAFREKEVFKRVKYFVGRTVWDYRITNVLNRNAVYYYGNELMRPVFYEPIEKRIPSTLTITTTLSGAIFKGFDQILKVASILKNELSLSFIWNVYGNVSPSFAEKNNGLRYTDLNINLYGIVTEDIIRDRLLSSTLYYHPSYMENSSNSIIEAQMSSTTPICQYVGGLPSLIKDGEDGFLVPANDPYQVAFLIRYLYENPEVNMQIGQNARERVIKEHDPKSIVDDLLDIYESVIKK